MKNLLFGFVLTAMSGIAFSASASPYKCVEAGSKVCAINQETGACAVGWTEEASENPTYACAKFVVQDFENISYTQTCRKVGSSACVVSANGNCTIRFEPRDYSNPMDACLRHVGAKSTPKYCRQHAGYACVVNANTGNCILNFPNRDYPNPMDACLRHLGQRGGSNRQGYFCRKAGMGYCSVNPKTNKCTRYWDDNRDRNEALRACERYVRN